MQRYFISSNQIQNNQITLQDNDWHHARNVMRFREGEQASFVDESGSLYLASLLESNKVSGIFEILQVELMSGLDGLPVTIAQALIRKEPFELVLEKATELGAAGFIPVTFERAVVKWDPSDYEKKRQRNQSIVKEASEQSERRIMPVVHDLVKLENLPFSNYDQILVCYERQDPLDHLIHQIPSLSKTKKTLVLIGPEGGISEQELAFLNQVGAKFVSLGSRILRSETASLYVLSVLSALWEM